MHFQIFMIFLSWIQSLVTGLRSCCLSMSPPSMNCGSCCGGAWRICDSESVEKDGNFEDELCVWNVGPWVDGPTLKRTPACGVLGTDMWAGLAICPSWRLSQLENARPMQAEFRCKFPSFGQWHFGIETMLISNGRQPVLPHSYGCMWTWYRRITSVSHWFGPERKLTAEVCWRMAKSHFLSGQGSFRGFSCCPALREIRRPHAGLLTCNNFPALFKSSLLKRNAPVFQLLGYFWCCIWIWPWRSVSFAQGLCRGFALLESFGGNGAVRAVHPRTAWYRHQGSASQLPCKTTCCSQLCDLHTSSNGGGFSFGRWLSTSVRDFCSSWKTPRNVASCQLCVSMSSKVAAMLTEENGGIGRHQ